MIVAFVNTKGGVAKTTSAMMTALALSRQGESVEVWDADPQGSASEWLMNARETPDPLPYKVRPVNLAMLKRANVAPDEFVLIDTPPGDPRVIDACALISDFIVIPTDSSPADIIRTLETYSALNGIARAVLVAKAETHTVLYKELISSLDEAELPYFSTKIPKRQGIKAALGTTPEDLDRYEEFSLELKEALK